MKSVYMDLGTTEAPDSANSSEHADKDAPSGVLPAALRVSLAVVLIVTMVVGILGNGVVCMLVYRKATMRSAINHLVAQLALADILLALVVMPFVLTGMLTVMPWSPGPSICSLFAFLQEMLVAVDTLILLTISVDRYLIIVRHREKLNTRRARCLIFVSWIYSFLITIPPLLGWGPFESYPGHLQCRRLVANDAKDMSYLLLSSIATKFVPLAVILYSCACIVLKVRKNILKVQHYPVHVSVTHTSRTNVLQPRTSLTTSLCSSPSTDNSVVLHTPTRLGPLGSLSTRDSRPDSSLSQRLVSFSSTSSLCCALQYQSRDSAQSCPTLCNLSSSRIVHGPQHGANSSRDSVNRGDQCRTCMLFSTTYPKASVRSRPNQALSHQSSLSAARPRTFSLAASTPRHLVRNTRRQTLDMSFKTRAFKTILLLSLLLLLCWMPYTVTVLFTSLTLQAHPDLLCLLLVLGLMKSAFYPVVYAVRIRKFRAAIRLALPKKVPGATSCSRCLAVLLTKRRVNPSTAYRCSDTSSV